MATGATWGQEVCVCRLGFPPGPQRTHESQVVEVGLRGGKTQVDPLGVFFLFQRMCPVH